MKKLKFLSLLGIMCLGTNFNSHSFDRMAVGPVGVEFAQVMIEVINKSSVQLHHNIDPIANMSVELFIPGTMLTLEKITPITMMSTALSPIWQTINLRVSDVYGVPVTFYQYTPSGMDGSIVLEVLDPYAPNIKDRVHAWTKEEYSSFTTY